MKTLKKFILVFLLLPVFNTSYAQEKITKTASIRFYSEVGGISADNYSVTSKINTETGAILFSAAIQSFKFKNALMQKHFNQEDVMDSPKFPKAKFKGKIMNNSSVNYSKDGSYKVTVKGDMTIKGATKSIETAATIEVKNGKYIASAKFDLNRFEYGVEGKEESVSKVLEITVNATYE